MDAPLQLGFTALLTAEQRAHQLLAGETDIPLSPEERTVLRELTFHVGRRQPVLRVKLAEKFQLGDRTVKEIIRNLIVTHNVAIGASRGKDPGYFLVADAEDLDVAASPLESELIEIARRLRVLKGPQRLAELYGQLNLDKETA